MAGKAREKTHFVVTFTRDDDLYQVCARRVAASELYGLIEIGDFIFPENRLVYNPGEERIRREFSGVKRTWIPCHAIVRIDEVADGRDSEIKVVRLEPGRKPQPAGPLREPEP